MQRNRGLLAIALLAPAIFLFLALTIYPLGRVLALSLFATDYGFEGATFVGTENYSDLVGHRFFRTAAWNTLVFAILATVSEVGIGLTLALLVNGKMPGSRFVVPALLAPIPTSQCCRSFWLTPGRHLR